MHSVHRAAKTDELLNTIDGKAVKSRRRQFDDLWIALILGADGKAKSMMDDDCDD